jgi:hypothetical protein
MLADIRRARLAAYALLEHLADVPGHRDDPRHRVRVVHAPGAEDTDTAHNRAVRPAPVDTREVD